MSWPTTVVAIRSRTPFTHASVHARGRQRRRLLFDDAVAEDEHAEHPVLPERDEFDVAHGVVPSDGYCTTATWFVSCESSRTVRAMTSSQVFWTRQENARSRALGGGHRPQPRRACRRRACSPCLWVRDRRRCAAGRDELVVLEQRHVVTDRRSRDSEVSAARRWPLSPTGSLSAT